MSRWVSFIVLAAIVVLFGFLFYQVMAQFLLPLFMAVVLVIIFYPMHARFVQLFGGRQRLAAAVTTVAVMIIVLLPFFLILSMAAAEGVSLATRLAQPETLVDLQRFRNRIGLAWPSKETRSTNELVKTRLLKIDDLVAGVESGINPDAKANLDRLLKDTQQEMVNLMRDMAKGKQADMATGLWREDQELAWVKERQEASEMLVKLIAQLSKLDEELLTANEIHAEQTTEPNSPLPAPPIPAHPPNDEPEPSTPHPPATQTPTPKPETTTPEDTTPKATTPDGAEPATTPPEKSTPEDTTPTTDTPDDASPTTADTPTDETPKVASADTETPPITEEPNFLSGVLEDFSMSSFLPGGDTTPTVSSIPPPIDKDLAARMVALPEQYNEFERKLLGPSWVFGIKAIANPDDETVTAMLGSVQEWVAPVAKGTAGILVNLIVGLAVMMVALYYFLADGKAMVATLMKLSPIDDRHEQALLAQFQTISRAVVTATLVTAVAQGLLSGVGYYFAGLRQQAFLLTLVTMLTSMIPFVGAAAIWISCSLYLLLVEGNMSSAIGLALWGGLVVSMADNLIKPLILHGQSNLHPLLALLSVVGGVTALGPVGIFIGPMVVAFLQALLNILHNELVALEDESKAKNGSLAPAGAPSASLDTEPPSAIATSSNQHTTPTPSAASTTHPQTPSMKKNTRRKTRNKR